MSLKKLVKLRGGKALRSSFGGDRVARLGRILSDIGSDLPDNDLATNGENLLQDYALSSGNCSVVIDVGANVGDWSNQLLEFATERGVAVEKLLLVEAEPNTMEMLLERSLSFPPCGQLLFEQSAVSDSSGEASLTSYGAGIGVNSLEADTASPELKRTGKSISVNKLTLQALVEKYGFEIVDLVKIDTEGHDLAVLAGARELFEAGRISMIQFEYNHRWISSRTYLRDVFKLFASANYLIGRLGSDGLIVLDEWRPELENYREANYVIAASSLTPALTQYGLIQ